MKRPTSAAALKDLLTTTLIPAVEATIAGAAQAHDKAQADADKAAADKAAADQAAARAQAEQTEAEAEQADAAQKGTQATAIKDELATVAGLLGYVEKLPDPADQAGLFTIVSKQADKLLADLGMSYDPSDSGAAA